MQERTLDATDAGEQPLPPSMMSPVRIALAWVDAGVGWAAAADQAGLSVSEVGDLVLAQALSQLHQLQLEQGVQLLAEGEGCRLHGCDAPVHHRGLCIKHYSRLRQGTALLGPAFVRIRACRACGARWCLLPGVGRERTLCGAPACRATMRALAAARSQDRRHKSPHLSARDEAIMEQVRAGIQYRQIADEFGLSEPRIGQMARRAGIRRYRSRSR